MKLSRITQYTALLLIPALLHSSFAYAASKPVDAAAIKEKIATRGVGHGVRVTLTGKTEARGIIVSIGDQSFALKVKGADQPQSILYAQVTGVHEDGSSKKAKVADAREGEFSTGAKVGIAVGIGAMVLVVVVIVVGFLKALSGAAKHV
jgi:hypothetical protein